MFCLGKDQARALCMSPWTSPLQSHQRCFTVGLWRTQQSPLFHWSSWRSCCHGSMPTADSCKQRWSFGFSISREQTAPAPPPPYIYMVLLWYWQEHVLTIHAQISVTDSVFIPWIIIEYKPWWRVNSQRAKLHFSRCRVQSQYWFKAHFTQKRKNAPFPLCRIYQS